MLPHQHFRRPFRESALHRAHLLSIALHRFWLQRDGLLSVLQALRKMPWLPISSARQQHVRTGQRKLHADSKSPVILLDHAQQVDRPCCEHSKSRVALPRENKSPMNPWIRRTSCARCVESRPYMARLSDVAAGIERRCFARLRIGREAGWTWEYDAKTNTS